MVCLLNDTPNKIHYTRTDIALQVVRGGPDLALAKKACLSKFLVTRPARWRLIHRTLHNTVYIYIYNNNNINNILTYLVEVPDNIIKNAILFNIFYLHIDRMITMKTRWLHFRKQYFSEDF